MTDKTAAAESFEQTPRTDALEQELVAMSDESAKNDSIGKAVIDSLSALQKTLKHSRQLERALVAAQTELAKRDKCSYIGPMRDCPTHGESAEISRLRSELDRRGGGEAVAWGVPNSRPTEKAPLIDVLLDVSSAQYPQLLIPLYTQPSPPAAPIAERVSDEESKDALASRLIDAWIAEKGKKIPWAKAIQIIAIVTKQPDEERDHLLRMADDDDGKCEMCGRSDPSPPLPPAEDQDGKRYRTLRALALDGSFAVLRHAIANSTEDSFDAAIDAAMKKTK